jgi:allantoate deiminase
VNKRTEKLIARINDLASVSEDEHGITRLFGTAAAMEAGNKVVHWMREAGLRSRIDAIGNIRGIWHAEDENARTLVIASHIDTVRNAGRWDGPLGVLLGLDLLENIIASKKKLPFHIELIAFSDEEGVRFHTTYLGSKVVAGRFEPALLARKDEEGIALEEVIRLIGGDPAALEQEAIAPDRWLGYFEVHIEQGPILYEKNIPVALVKAIAGQIRAEVVFSGMAGHAGTVPMGMRKDALCAAAEFVLAVEALAADGLTAGRGLAAGEERTAGRKLVATVGKLRIKDAASNVIPGEVVCSLDLRSADQQALTSAYEEIGKMCAAIGRQRGVGVMLQLSQSSLPVACDEEMGAVLARSIESAGYEALSLVSGAGHDGVAISAVAPVAMLFVRCFKGISHHPLENVEAKDIGAAIAICDNFIHQLTEIWRYQH